MIITTRLSAGLYADLDEWSSVARRIETSGVDALVLDRETGPRPAPFEPTTLAGYLSQVTETIGIVAEDSALYPQPYHVARRLATLDHLTEGRAGWRLGTVGLTTEARGYEWVSPSASVDRVRATEFAEIVLELWDSWEEGAERPDKRAGDFHDDSRIHPIDYRSTSFLVRGPLDVPRSPQGRPAITVDVRDADDAELASIFADVAVIRTDSASTATELAAKLVDAIAGSGREGEVRILLAVSDLDRTGCLSVSAEPGEAVREIADAVAAIGAHGAEVVSDGSLESLDWLCDGIAPALTEPTSLPAESPAGLLARLGLADAARFGRRAA